MMRKNRFGWASALLAVGVFLWFGAPALRSSGSCSAAPSHSTFNTGDTQGAAVLIRGNETAPVKRIVKQETTAPEVTESLIEAGTPAILTVRFSKTMDAVTAVDPTKLYIRDSNNTGIEGDWALEGDSLSVVFTPDTADFSDEDFPFILTVTTGVKDSLGIALGRKYTRVFHAVSGAAFLTGEVYDDARSTPVKGAKVTLISIDGEAPEEPRPTTLTDADGRYSLEVPSGVVTLEIAAAGYTNVYRDDESSEGLRKVVVDARVTPQESASQEVTTTGGVFKGSSGDASVSFPSGCFPSNEPAHLVITYVGQQGLTNLLPLGWSPVGGADISQPDAAFGVKSAALKI